MSAIYLHKNHEWAKNRWVESKPSSGEHGSTDRDGFISYIYANSNRPLIDRCYGYMQGNIMKQVKLSCGSFQYISKYLVILTAEALPITSVWHLFHPLERLRLSSTHSSPAKFRHTIPSPPAAESFWPRQRIR